VPAHFTTPSPGFARLNGIAECEDTGESINILSREIEGIGRSPRETGSPHFYCGFFRPVDFFCGAAGVAGAAGTPPSLSSMMLKTAGFSLTEVNTN
jgi:hypothetical protein